LTIDHARSQSGPITPARTQSAPGHRVRLVAGALLTAAGLGVTAALPDLARPLFVPTAVVAVLVAAALMLGGQTEHGGWAGRLGALRALLLHLAPVLLLMVAYPLAAQRIHTSVGGTPLLTLLLASSVTVPWLSQPACLPLYRAVGDLLPVREEKDLVPLERRMVAAWPRVFVQALPSVLLFAVPLQLVFGWSAAAFGTYLALAVLHLLFVQSVVVTNVAQRRGLWALSWLVYAAALFVAPTWWFLPPVLATTVQLWSLRNPIRALLRGSAQPERLALARVDLRLTWADIAKGFLLGSVLWADKLLLFATTGGRFDVDVVYLAMLPVVLAYNYYFVRLAPIFDRQVIDVRHALENESFGVLHATSRRLVDDTARALVRTAAVAALLNAGVVAILGLARPGVVALAVAVSIASWLFMAATLLGYKLDYVGRGGVAMLLGGLHLVLVVAAFAFFPVLDAYVVMIAGESVLVAAAAAVAYSTWSSPSYTLFWRHATSW